MPYPFLQGVSVVESSAFVPAPLAGLALAQFGADVIRIDAIGGGIDYRRAPRVPDSGRSLFWASLNAGKRSLAIDFRRPEARELVQELVCRTGNLLTNRAASWLNHSLLVERRHDLISCLIEGNPDGSSVMECTLSSATGFPMLARENQCARPVNSQLPAWDVVTAYQAAFAFLGAINRRLVRGEGALIKIAMSDVAFSTMSHLGLLAEAEVLDRDRGAVGNHIYGAFGRDFETADGQRLMVAAITASQWHSLISCCGVGGQIGQLEAQLNLDFNDEMQRYAGRESIVALLEPWFRSRSFAEVGQRLDQFKVSWGKYSSVKQLLNDDPRVGLSNPIFETLATEGVGTHISAKLAARFEGLESTPNSPAPLLGTHTDEVLHDVLGLSGIEIARLHDSGVVAGPDADPFARV
ncbi:2-methylfumaryl-CoA isomerase [Pseudomonas sp. LB-090624]|uniref:CoA transferase n=1 Tax=Pseudomonas sp. LB-090624 TaxID=2213079 RepID=UPI000D8884B6|nr:CoA transferase [Pseudomonas sp. LB-090624]PYB78968.1 2-methylfumaryl-CoA isomerase [Pseudomonas sp. LB-090624]